MKIFVSFRPLPKQEIRYVVTETRLHYMGCSYRYLFKLSRNMRMKN